MADPHHFHLYVTSAASQPPAITVTHTGGGGQGNEARPTNQVSGGSGAYVAAPAAYDANLPDSLDSETDISQYSSTPTSRSVTGPSTIQPESSLARTSQSSADATSTREPIPESFGAEHWVEPFAQYFNFAPQPSYELTGELVHEQVSSFQEFDSPTSVKSSASLPSAEAHVQPSDFSNVPPNTETAAPGNVFVQPRLPKSALKRKAEQEAALFLDQGGEKRQRGPEFSLPGRSVSFERMSRPSPTSHREDSANSDLQTPQRGATSGNNRRNRPAATTGSTPRGGSNVPSAATQSAQRGSRSSRGSSTGQSPSVLPPEKVYPIQIGSELFRLSGASISSDAPSYFTQFFEEQIRVNEDSGGVRTLYIDRDPSTFRDVARHLQGYHIKPVDGSHFVKLFADAQFYSLPRLIDQLFESEIFIQIGERHFQIPKDIFSDPGNSPNFFSLGFAVFFSTPGEVFPGLDRRGLLRPPSIVPPYVPGRSSEIFAQLLHLLRGYPLHVRDEEHRSELLRDCRYFHLRGLEQRLIAHDITYNLGRQKSEICIRLEDVKPSGVSFAADDSTSEKSGYQGWVNYARPFVDENACELIIEIGGECTTLDLEEMRADFHGLAKARVSSLFQVVANKMNLPTNAPLGLMMLSGGQASQPASPSHTPLSEDRVKVRIEEDTDIMLDGEAFEVDWNAKYGQVMLHGPQPENEPESDAMSETSSTRGVSKGSSRASGRLQQQSSQAGPSGVATASRSSLNVPPIQTSSLPIAKKRKRQQSTDDIGEWTIRNGQWRLRIQNNPRDTIRGGMELVFVAVKLDAFTGERARNARRGFLS